MKLLIRTNDSFDPSAILREVSVKFERVDDLSWVIESDNHLRGLSLLQKTSTSEIVSITTQHPVDSDGWEDWHQSAPGEHEVHTSILPNYATVSSEAMVYRYEDIWFWDESKSGPSITQLRRFGLEGITEPLLERTLGRGKWAFKALKLVWTNAGRLKDPRIQAAIWVGKQGWEKLKTQSIEQRQVWGHMEWERRTLLQLTDERRKRLETGSPSSRRKARQYYTTLDKLIEINSR